MRILDLNRFNEKMKIVPLSDEDFRNISDDVSYNYCPKTKEELESIISKRIGEDGFDCDLNDIDVSKIKDMSFLFAKYEKRGGFIEDNISAFYGDISKWDVSNVKNMEGMFFGAGYFNGDISKWNVSNVKGMRGMFEMAKSFNGDISKWNVSKVTDMSNMFYYAQSFECDISGWDVSNVEDMRRMFNNAYRFSCNISKWNVKNLKKASYMFIKCPLEKQPELQPAISLECFMN